MKIFCPECQTMYEDESLEYCPNDGGRLFTLEASETHDPLIGAIIDGRFRMDNLLGQGGMGAVYKGVQLSVNRQVAIKVLRTELLDRELALERFYRESKIISGLTHPNIVRLIDFGQDRERDLLYLVMELVSGHNLGDLIERGRFRVSLALEIIYQVCGALTEPHRYGVIHRDLKPDNLLLVPVSDGTLQVKVLDFGIARALETNTQLTADGMVCGTPQYMAPEQAQNGVIGPPTDLYALGVMLYEMLTGTPPFTGRNSLQIMLQQIQVAPSPLASMLPSGALPLEVEDLANDMLCKAQDARPQTARDVRDRIDGIRRDYRLDLVRLDTEALEHEVFAPWLLERLPKTGSGGALSHTEALRRETGLNKKPSGSTHTTGEALAFAHTMSEELPEPATPVSKKPRVEAHVYANSHTSRDASHLPVHPHVTPIPKGSAPSKPEHIIARTASMEHYPQLEHVAESRDRGDTKPLMDPPAQDKSRVMMAAAGVVVLFIIIASAVLVNLLINRDKSGLGSHSSTSISTHMDPKEEPAQDLAKDPSLLDLEPQKGTLPVIKGPTKGAIQASDAVSDVLPKRQEILKTREVPPSKVRVRTPTKKVKKERRGSSRRTKKTVLKATVKKDLPPKDLPPKDLPPKDPPKIVVKKIPSNIEKKQVAPKSDGTLGSKSKGGKLNLFHRIKSKKEPKKSLKDRFAPQ